MKEWIRRLLLAICVCVFAYSAFQLIKIYYNYVDIEEKTEELVTQYVVDVEEDPLKRVVNFEELQEKNSDIIGWIYIPDTNIDEAILKGKNNDSYLRTGIDKKYNSAGQIFIDEINKKDFKDDNTIIYGHNMKNGSRFHNLRYYMEKDFFNEKKLVYIYLPNQTVNVYEVYSASIVNASSEFYQKGIDYQSYTKKALSKAKQKREVNEKKAPLILLSTCYDTDSDNRYVVFARLDKNVKQEG